MASLFLAEINYSNGQIDSTKYFLKKSHELSKKASRFEQLIVNQVYYTFMMNSDKAKNLEDSLLTEFPDKFDVKVIKAQNFFKNGDNKAARDIYFNILKENPNYKTKFCKFICLRKFSS